MFHIWLIPLLALISFLAVILIRAIRFKPKAQPKVSEEAIDFDKAGAVAALQSLIRFKTV